MTAGSELRARARLVAASGREREVFGIPARGCARWRDGELAALGAPLVRFRCADPPVRLADLDPP